MRISDGSSDECSSDHEIGASLSVRPLMRLLGVQFLNSFAFGSLTSLFVFFAAAVLDLDAQSAVLLFASFIGGAHASTIWTFPARRFGQPPMMIDRKSGVEGKSVLVRVHLGGGRIISKQTTTRPR